MRNEVHKPDRALRSSSMAGNAERDETLPAASDGEDILLTLSRLLFDRSAALNLRFEEIAEKAGVHVTTVDSIATCRGNPTLNVLVDILNVLKCRVVFERSDGTMTFKRQGQRQRRETKKPMRRGRCMGRV